jgi:hypothetical protein
MAGSRPARGASFTARVLAELALRTPALACCRGALIEGMAATHDAGDALLRTSRLITARAALQSLHACGIPAHASRIPAARGARYRVVAEAVPPPSSGRPCCARWRLRGAFLATGTVGRPEAAAHLEIPVRDEAGARSLRDDCALLGIVASATRRRARWLLTIRSTAGVGDTLTVIGAHAARLRFEEGRVMGELRSHVNRGINAETANLRRGVGAAVRQRDAITTLRQSGGRWQGLPAAVRAAADLRERHPDDSLERLAERAECSRSAMAGRLHRLVESARGAAAGSVAGSHGRVPDPPRPDRGRW